MATHDYIISNASGAAVRADLNNALAAIVSNNSNASSPSTTYAYQWWADTTTGQLKLRNSANSAWITIFELDGTMLMEDGSAASPGLAFASDLNTGFFRSAADKINFATGGVERLEIGSSEVVFNDGSNDVDFRVESNGQTHMLFVDGGNDRVGIGTSSPVAGLTVAKQGTVLSGTSNSFGFSINPQSNGYVYLDAVSSGSLNTSLSLRTYNNGTYTQVIQSISGNATTFETAGSERLRIDSSGNVGIANTTPSSYNSVADDLVVGNHSGAHGITIAAQNNNTGYLTWADGTGSGENNVGRIAYSHADNSMRFDTSASERLRIDSSGKIGIGETAPLGKVHIKNGDSGGSVGSSADELVIENSDFAGLTLLGNSQGLINFADSSDVNVGSITYDHASNFMSFRVNDSERFRVDSSGRLGVGTTAPSYTTHINSAGATSLGVTTSSSSSEPQILFEDTAANDYFALQKDGRELTFKPQGAEAMRIDGAGRLLVGTSTAQTLPTASSFQVSGTDFATSSIRQTRFESGTSGPSIILAHARGSEASNQSLANNDELGKIRFQGHDGTDFNNLGAEIIGEVDGTPGSDDMPGRLLFRTTADGASSPTERMRISSDGSLFINRTSAVSSEKFSVGNDGQVAYFRCTVNGDHSNIQMSHSFATGGQTATQITFQNAALTAVGSIKSTASSTSFNTSSDYRLKENVVNIADGITRVKQLLPKRFNFIVNADKTVDGFLAHEAQAVVPEAVTGEKDGEEMQGIDQSKLVPLLTAALQEAIAKIETLETKVAALEAG